MDGYKVQDNSYGIADFQSELLVLLKEFIKICEKYNLRWWIDSGSLIGTLRHNGFIPWDDDLDVAMPRPDYEKLWSLRDEVNKNGRFLICRTGEKKNYHHRVMQLVDTNTTFIHTRSAHEDIEHGVYIDVLPIDGRAPTKLGFLNQAFNASLYSIYNIQCLPEYNDGKTVGTIVKIALAIIQNKHLRYKIWKHCEKRMTRWDFDKTEYVCQICCDTRTMRTPFKSEWVRSVKKHQFEDIEVNIPIGADLFLRQYFGDYMQLPPEEKRHPVHNTVLIDLEHPYTQYRGKYYCVEKSEDNK